MHIFLEIENWIIGTIITSTQHLQLFTNNLHEIFSLIKKHIQDTM